jgi:hypothetical protein
MSKRLKSKTYNPEVMVQNCNFNGGDSEYLPAILAVARALEANANALNELSKNITFPHTLLHVGPKE